MLQTVKGRYLWLFISFPLVYSVGMYLLYFLNLQAITSIVVSDIVVTLAFLPTLYYLLGYYFVVRQVGRAYALIIGLFITAIPIVIGFALDGGYMSIQASISIALMFISAMVGPIAIFGLLWVHLIGYILVATGAMVGNTENGLLFLLAYAGSGLIGWLVFHRNYTHDSQAVLDIRHTLHEEQLKSAALLAALDDGIVVISAQGQVQLCSDVALTYLGINRADTLHRSYKTLFIHATKRTDPGTTLEQAIIDKTPATINLISIQRDGSPHPFDLSAYIQPIINEDDEVGAYMMILHDISSFSRAERLKNDFISMAGHELRTPATVIAGYADLLLNPTFGTLSKEQKQFVERTKQTTEHLIHFVNNMLDITRLESGQQDDRPETLDIAKECKSALAALRAHFKQKHLRLITHLPPEQILIRVDKARLHQVLDNLLSNAHTYSNEHGKITLTIQATDTNVTVSISDTGRGISPENQQIIFDKFSRLSVDTSAEGTGLGLAITREIITAWGGIINVESDGHHGSQFYFTIPRHTLEQTKETTI